MRIEDRIGTQNGLLNWTAWALLLNEQKHGEHVSASVLHERTNGQFGNVSLLADALHTLAYERNVVDARPDPENPDRTIYGLKSDGRVAAKRLGKPEEKPEEMLEAVLEATLPAKGERAEAANGMTVEFSHFSNGKLHYVGPLPDKDDGKNYCYSAESVDEKPTQDTIDLSPDWDWLGAQLFKLGDRTTARRAFKGKLTPAEVYGPIFWLLEEHKHKREYELDFGNNIGDGLTVHETPVDPDELEAIKRELGLDAKTTA